MTGKGRVYTPEELLAISNAKLAEWEEERRRFARKYIEKANKHYWGVPL